MQDYHPEHPEKQHESTLKDLKRQMDRLTGEVGKLVVALQGDQLGNEGILPRVLQIEKEMADVKRQMEDMQLAMRKKEIHVAAIVGLVMFILGSAAKALFDHLIPIKK